MKHRRLCAQLLALAGGLSQHEDAAGTSPCAVVSRCRFRCDYFEVEGGACAVRSLALSPSEEQLGALSSLSLQGMHRSFKPNMQSCVGSALCDTRQGY